MFALGGMLYYSQQRALLVKNEILSMINYSKLVKHSNQPIESKGFSYTYFEATPQENDPASYREDEHNFYKEFHQRRRTGGMLVIKSKEEYNTALETLRMHVIVMLCGASVILSLISLWLARLAIAPMQETIAVMDQFIKDVIHDINTPISALLLNLKLLKRTATTEQLRKVERIEASADTIASLYENMSILLSEEKLAKSPVRLDEVVKARMDAVALIYPQLTFTCTCEKPVIVHTHLKALERIVDNLLVNACKYNKEHGSVMLTCKENMLQVSDTGIGIQFPERIFERHYHENESGFGIGMHIVHRLCESLNISVSIHSVKGVGTTFNLRFA